jgi:hypothetical protein
MVAFFYDSSFVVTLACVPYPLGMSTQKRTTAGLSPPSSAWIPKELPDNRVSHETGQGLGRTASGGWLTWEKDQEFLPSPIDPSGLKPLDHGAILSESSTFRALR